MPSVVIGSVVIELMGIKMGESKTKKYQIFISSTYTDLIPQRTAVRDAILRMNQFPVGMEQFGAVDEEQWEIIKQTIDTSDYYVLILGYRYGSVITTGGDIGISYTEIEYRYAKDKRVPILAFLPDTDSVQIDPKQLEGDDKRKKLELFKESVKGSKLIDHWKNEDDLAAKVTAALYKQFDRTDRPGWVRGDSIEQSLQVITDLHKRIKSLEEENQEFKKNIVIRKPGLVIKIGCNETLEEAEDKFRDWNNSVDREKPLYVVTDDGLVIYMKRIPKSCHLGNTDKLTVDDIPEKLRNLLSEEQLKDYNENLPSAEAINNHNAQMYRYKSVKDNGVVLKIGILNNGNLKATDIHIDFEFPKSFFVTDKANAIDLAMPKKPKMPSNPILKAEEEFENSHRSILNTHGSSLEYAVGLMADSYRNLPIGLPSKSAFLAESVRSLDADWSVNVKKGHARIWKDELLHTYEWNGGEFVIAPTEAGEFTVSISAICEELSEPIESEYRIEVVDSGY